MIWRNSGGRRERAVYERVMRRLGADVRRKLDESAGYAANIQWDGVIDETTKALAEARKCHAASTDGNEAEAFLSVLVRQANSIVLLSRIWTLLLKLRSEGVNTRADKSTNPDPLLKAYMDVARTVADENSAASDFIKSLKSAL